MNNTYTLSCIAWNSRHAKFNVFDYKGANCGTITIESTDVEIFIRGSWNGSILWNNLLPKDSAINAGR